MGLAHRIKRWLLAAIGLSFTALGVDTFFEHFITLHHQAQWIPIIFGPVAGMIALATAWRPGPLTLRLFFIAAWLAVAVGVLGLYYHGATLMARLGGSQAPLDWRTLLTTLRYGPPIGAPFAFAGMGVLGLLIRTCSRKLEGILGRDGAAGERAAPGLLAYGLFGLAFLALVVAPLMPMVLHRLL